MRVKTSTFPEASFPEALPIEASPEAAAPMFISILLFVVVYS